MERYQIHCEHSVSACNTVRLYTHVRRFYAFKQVLNYFIGLFRRNPRILCAYREFSWFHPVLSCPTRSYFCCDVLGRAVKSNSIHLKSGILSHNLQAGGSSSSPATNVFTINYYVNNMLEPQQAGRFFVCTSFAAKRIGPRSDHGSLLGSKNGVFDKP